MSTQFYWCVKPAEAWGKRKVWPQQFHFRASHAKEECFEMNKREAKFNKPRKYIVERVLLEEKGKTHFDLYEHSTIRTEKPL